MANKIKQEYGTGSISQRKDGKWQGRVNLGTDINGKRKQKYFYGNTEKEVKKKLKDYFIQGKKYNANNIAKMTLEEFLVDWLENILVNTLKPKSYAIKEYIIKQQIVPRIDCYKSILLLLPMFNKSLTIWSTKTCHTLLLKKPLIL